MAYNSITNMMIINEEIYKYNIICYVLLKTDDYIFYKFLVKYNNNYFSVCNNSNSSVYDLEILTKYRFKHYLLSNDIYDVYFDKDIIERPVEEFDNVIGLCKNRVRLIKIDNIL